MGFVPFNQLTGRQKIQAKLARPRWSETDFPRFQFWVRGNGDVSLRAGHHTLTAEEGAKIDAMLRGDDVRTRGDLKDYRTAGFTMAPE